MLLRLVHPMLYSYSGLQAMFTYTSVSSGQLYSVCTANQAT